MIEVLVGYRVKGSEIRKGWGFRDGLGGLEFGTAWGGKGVSWMGLFLGRAGGALGANSFIGKRDLSCSFHLRRLE